MAFSLGIDVGKTALQLALRDGEGAVAKTAFPNDSNGHEDLLSWLSNRGAGPEKTCICMESSGAFEESVALRLHEEGYRVSVVNPRRIKGYASSPLQRTKTDSADAALIARFGWEDLRTWKPSSEAESRLQELTRARQALQNEKTRTRTDWMRQMTKQFAGHTVDYSRRSTQEAWKGEDGRNRSGDAEALAYLLRGLEVRTSV